MTPRPDWLLPRWNELEGFPADRIAKQLGALRRFAGATPDHYSVARHCLVVQTRVPLNSRLNLLALLHDAHECWTGDILRPAHELLGPEMVELQKEIDVHLWRLLGIDPTYDELLEVDAADDWACECELSVLGNPAGETEDIPSGALWHLTFMGNARVDAMHWLDEFNLAMTLFRGVSKP